MEKEQRTKGSQTKEHTLDRRQFLQSFAWKAAKCGLALHAVGPIVNAWSEQIDETIAGEDTNKKYEDARKELKEILDKFSEQKNSLTPEEIQERIKPHASFLGDPTGVPIIELGRIQQPAGSSLSGEEFLISSIEKMITDGHIKLNKDTLNIITLPCDNLVFNAASFYISEMNTMFFNQEDQSKQRETMERWLYEQAIRLEYDRKSNLGHNAELAKEAWKWAKPLIDTGGTLAMLPKELLTQHRVGLAELARWYCMRGKSRFAGTILSVDHEVFHYFFDQKFGKSGYSGPSVKELLFHAIKSKRERFGVQRLTPIYGTDLEEFLVGVDVNDQNSLEKFYNKLTDQGVHDLSDNRATDKEHPNALLTVQRFLDEYLARIFNGAMGYTPQKAREVYIENIKDETYVSQNIPNYLLEGAVP